MESLLEIGFLTIGILDLLDILLVTILIYLVYKLVKGSIAVNIFIGFLSIYLFWWIVQALDMQLLSDILGQFIGVGVLALLIVFQQEVRRFLLFIGKNSPLFKNPKSWRDFLPWDVGPSDKPGLDMEPVLEACETFSSEKTGALIVLAKSSELKFFAASGTQLDSGISAKLLLSIFQKYSPLHDGACIIANNRVKAAGCVLPVSEIESLPGYHGMRHRAALGVSEQTDAFTVVVSEETGTISTTYNGEIDTSVTLDQLKKQLKEHFYDTS